MFFWATLTWQHCSTTRNVQRPVLPRLAWLQHCCRISWIQEGVRHWPYQPPRSAGEWVLFLPASFLFPFFLQAPFTRYF